MKSGLKWIRYSSLFDGWYYSIKIEGITYRGLVKKCKHEAAKQFNQDMKNIFGNEARQIHISKEYATVQL